MIGQTCPSNANREPVYVATEDHNRMKEIWDKHANDIYGAYEQDPKLFGQLLPLWAHVPIANDKITDEQAKIIFPLLRQGNFFQLDTCPNLTGNCLQYLPKHITWLSTPKGTQYSHLQQLSKDKFPKLTYLFVYSAQTGSAADLKFLRETTLTRLQIEATANPQAFCEHFPATLKILQITNGAVGDKDLSDYLKTRATQLESIYLLNVANVTAAAFQVLPKSLQQATVFNCTAIDRDLYMKYTQGISSKGYSVTEKPEKAEPKDKQ